MTTKQVFIVFFLLIGILSILLQIPLFISLLKQFYCNKQQEIERSYKWSVICIFIFSIICSITGIKTAIFLIPDTIHLTAISINEWISFIAISAESLFIYSFLLFRIYYTFKQSIYEMQRFIIYLHTINIALIFLSLILTIFSGYALLLWIILLTIGYIHLLYLFNDNLFVLMLSQKDTMLNEYKTSELSERQINILSTIRKHTILGVFIVVSNLLLIGVYLLLFVIPMMTLTDTMTYVVLCIVNFIAYIFITVAPLCIYLGFQKNQKLYLKICGVCDGKCKDLCIRFTERKLDIQDNDSDQLQMSYFQM